MNRIEEGCMAIVVESACVENIGEIVRVGKYIGSIEIYNQGRLWEVDKRLVKVGSVTGDTIYDNVMTEDYMQRIDDTDTEKQPNHETKEDISQ